MALTPSAFPHRPPASLPDKRSQAYSTVLGQYLRVPCEQLTQLDFHHLDCSPVGCSSGVLCGSRSAGRQCLFASALYPASAPVALHSRILCRDSKFPCSARKVTSGAAAELNSPPHVLNTIPLPRPRVRHPQRPSWPTCFIPDGHPIREWHPLASATSN
jgi:hypothetical protein